MFFSWGSCCFDSIVASWRTAKTDHRYKKGNVGSLGSPLVGFPQYCHQGQWTSTSIPGLPQGIFFLVLHKIVNLPFNSRKPFVHNPAFWWLSYHVFLADEPGSLIVLSDQIFISLYDFRLRSLEIWFWRHLSRRWCCSICTMIGWNQFRPTRY